MHTQALRERQRRLWDTAHDPRRAAAMTVDDLASEADFAATTWAALVDPQRKDLRDGDDAPSELRMDLREYLRALLLLATRVRARWSLVNSLPRPTLHAMVEHVAALSDDGDGPSEAYTLALQLAPHDPDLRARLVFWIEEADGYVCTEGFDDVAAADPANAATWRSYKLLSTYAQYCSWRTRDDAALMLVELLQRRDAPPLAAVRELADSEPWSLPLPRADDWELIASLLEA